MRILILGAGMYVTGRNNTGIGTVLASVIQASKLIEIEDVTIVARSDNNTSIVNEKSKELNDQFNTDVKVNYRSSSDLNSFLKDNKFDCCIVSTPDDLHFEQIKTLYNNGIHVLCVKPLVNTAHENIELMKLSEEKELLGIVEFHKRFDEANQYTKKIINEGKLGELLYYHVDYSQRSHIPLITFKDWVSKTNIFQYLGVHYVDLYYYLTGFIPERVMAYGTYGKLKENGIDNFDSIHAQIIWKNPKNDSESISTFNTNWIDPDITSALSDQKYKIIGTEGRIENDHKNRGVELVSNSTNIQHPNPYFSEYLLDINDDLFLNGYGIKSIEGFLIDVRDIKSNKKAFADFKGSRPSFRDSLVSTIIVELVNKSLKNNSEWELIDESIFS